MSNQVDSVIRLRLAASNLVRYFNDKEYAEEMDARAQVATDGNVSAFDALVSELRESLEPIPAGV